MICTVARQNTCLSASACQRKNDVSARMCSESGLQRSGELLPLLLGLAAPLTLAPLVVVPRRSELASTCSVQSRKQHTLHTSSSTLSTLRASQRGYTAPVPLHIVFSTPAETYPKKCGAGWEAERLFMGMAMALRAPHTCVHSG